VRPKPSRRSTVLHRHYAFDNTGPRGSCKRFARRGPNEKRPMAQLTTRRLRLRQWRAADLESFASLNADPLVMELMPRCLTRAESDELALRAAAEIEQRGWGLWAVQLREGGDFLGAAGLCVPSFEAHFTPCVEIDWRLKRPSWGHGYSAAKGGAGHKLRPLKRLDLKSTSAVVRVDEHRPLAPRARRLGVVPFCDAA